VINVTAQHQGAEATLPTQARSIHAISSRTLVVLMGAELVLIFGVLFWALLWLLPTNTPFAAQNDLTPVVEAVRGSASGSLKDPLIAVMPAVSARASNLRGLSLDGVTYYYYIEGRANFDPLSRGTVSNDEVEVMLRDPSGPSSIVIYRLLEH
jgi:hypothetical protein